MMSSDRPIVARVTPLRRTPRRGEDIMVVLVFLAGVVLPGLLGLWYLATPNVVTAEADAGRFLTVVGTHDATVVQTTTGTVAIAGTFSAPHDSVLVIRKSIKHGERLCVVGRPDTCVSLASAWAGPMREAPHPWYAFDFHEFGIAGYKLLFVLMLGTFTTFAGLISVSAGGGQDRARDQQLEATP